MKVTNIVIEPIYNREKLKGLVSITFDDCLTVHDLKIINGKKGIFVAMPSKKLRDNKFVDIAHPVTEEFRSLIEKKVLEKYDSLGNLKNNDY